MLNNEDQLSLTDESVLVTIEVNKHWNSENMGLPYSVLSFYLGEPFIEWKKPLRNVLHIYIAFSLVSLVLWI